MNFCGPPEVLNRPASCCAFKCNIDQGRADTFSPERHNVSNILTQKIAKEQFLDIVLGIKLKYAQTFRRKKIYLVEANVKAVDHPQKFIG